MLDIIYHMTPKTSNKFNTFNNIGVGMLDSIFHMTVSDTEIYFEITFFGKENVKNLPYKWNIVMTLIAYHY